MLLITILFSCKKEEIKPTPIVYTYNYTDLSGTYLTTGYNTTWDTLKIVRTSFDDTTKTYNYKVYCSRWNSSYTKGMWSTFEETLKLNGTTYVTDKLILTSYVATSCGGNLRGSLDWINPEINFVFDGGTGTSCDLRKLYHKL